MVACALASLAVAGCSTALKREQLPFDSKVIEVAPGRAYERCVEMWREDRLYFTYHADPPMGFSLRQQEGEAVVSYLVRDPSREDSGVFLVPQPGRYCLHWSPERDDRPWPTLLHFELRLTGRSTP